MRAVDTNVLVRLAVRDDKKQAEAAEVFVAAGAWVLQPVLVEFVWVLESVYELDRQQIAAAVEILLDHAQLTLDGSEVVVAAVAQYRKVTAVSFADCLVLELARKAGHLPLGTFDRDLGRLAGTETIGGRGGRTRR